jgi:MFS transporter, OFA family, oxalate/formate antiporter
VSQGAATLESPAWNTATPATDWPAVSAEALPGGPAGSLAVELAGRTRAEPVRWRLYYGWWILLMVMASTIATFPGQTFGISILSDPMRVDLGLSHSQLALAYSLGSLFSAVPIVLCGWLIDRFGLRRVLMSVVGLFSLACWCMAAANSWWGVLIGFTMLRMIGPGCMSLVSGNTLPFWFQRRLGLVEGLRQSGMAVAMIGIAPLNLYLVSSLGWRGAYFWIGVVILAGLLPLLAAFFRNQPSDIGYFLDGRPRESDHDAVSTDSNADPVPSSVADVPDAGHAGVAGMPVERVLRAYSFWVLTLGTSLFGLIMTALLFCVFPILEERGLVVGQASMFLMTLAIGLTLLQLLGGWLSDFVPTHWQLACGLLGLVAGITWLGLTEDPVSVILAGGLLGSSQGLYFAAANPAFARYFGNLHLGRIRGVLMTINIASGAFGPSLAGLVRDLSGSFDLVLVLFGLLAMPLAIASLWAVRPIATASGSAI